MRCSAVDAGAWASVVESGHRGWVESETCYAVMHPERLGQGEIKGVDLRQGECKGVDLRGRAWDTETGVNADGPAQSRWVYMNFWWSDCGEVPSPSTANADERRVFHSVHAMRKWARRPITLGGVGVARILSTTRCGGVP